MTSADVVIIGGGIAGASVAAELSRDARVILIEMESQPGYHATGRSNALFHETYGGPLVQPLTTASRVYLETGGFLSPRATITLGKVSDRPKLQEFAETFDYAGVNLTMIGRDAISAALPGVRPDWTHAVVEPDSADIDVAGLHQGFLAKARSNGADLVYHAPVTEIRRDGSTWIVQCGAQKFQTDTIVNAAGAWADQIARLAGVRELGLTPYRRTIIQLCFSRHVPADAPMVIDVNGGFYFRPGGSDRVWLSPHDETVSAPCDAAPEELDVAIAIDRFEQVVDWPIQRVEHKWAGLRTFAPDRIPVYGFAPEANGFFWCAGQGGFGIQTAPAAGQLCAALIAGATLPDPIKHIDHRLYDPLRFV